MRSHWQRGDPAGGSHHSLIKWVWQWVFSVDPRYDDLGKVAHAIESIGMARESIPLRYFWFVVESDDRGYRTSSFQSFRLVQG
jgi:hypothetical protein